jgi:hypothetical protein
MQPPEILHASVLGKFSDAARFVRTDHHVELYDPARVCCIGDVGTTSVTGAALIFALVAMALLAFGFHHQGYPVPSASEKEPQVPLLMFFTLGVSLLIAAAAFVAFLRSRRNAEIAKSAIVGRT